MLAIGNEAVTKDLQSWTVLESERDYGMGPTCPANPGLSAESSRTPDARERRCEPLRKEGWSGGPVRLSG